MNRKLFIVVMAVFLMVIPAGFLSAKYNIDELKIEMEDVTTGLSDFLGSNLGGMSYIGDPVGYAFIKHLAIGAAGGVVLVPVENLSFAEGTSLDIDFGDLKYIPVLLKGWNWGQNLPDFPPTQQMELM